MGPGFEEAIARNGVVDAPHSKYFSGGGLCGKLAAIWQLGRDS
jgi:hypothetical protein